MAYHQMQPNGFFLPTGEMINHAVTFAPNSWLQNAKPRLRWTEELHEVFVRAVSLLGGPDEAKPTAINQAMERMGVYGLTLRQVKSHLQKYRNSCKMGREEPKQPPLEEFNNKINPAGPSFVGPSFVAPPPPTVAVLPLFGYNMSLQIANDFRN